MTTVVIVVVVIVAVVVIALVALRPQLRARKEQRELESRRGEAADRHHGEAEDRRASATVAQQQADRQRAEADLSESKAELHERGLADDELDSQAESSTTPPPDRPVSR